VHPVLFRIGDFEITSFGALVALGALIGLWVFRRELRRSRLPDDAVDTAVAGLAGGIVGAKLLWVFEHLGEEPFTSLLFSRGGLSWFGGFVGGILAGLVVMHRRRLAPWAILAAASPALAIGHAIGRVGCLLVGDDYGRATTLPWGIAFPEGLPPTTTPVHPTQIYEALGLLPIAWLLMRQRAEGAPDRRVVAWYLVLAGTLRFGIEFIRVDKRVVGPLSVAHLASIAVVATGIVLLLTTRRRTA
jgi:phosphatidylglycerol:prolipoprotein diacylglycerol transferase